MRSMASWQSITVFYIVLGLSLQETKATLVDNYVDLISRRTKESLSYDFPEDARMYKAADETIQEFGEFDFIIIGAGSTGSVIASRLSEICSWKILLLEAGTFSDEDLTKIPALWIQDGFTKFNWGFKSVPQKYACQGNKDKICPLPRGKGVGGSSLINCAFYTRGNELDYERWSALLDDSSWNLANVLKYFKKAESFTQTNPYVPIDVDYHGFGGVQQITQSRPPLEISNNIMQGGQELGYNITDYNGRQQMGSSVFQYFVKDGKRFDPSMAYIEPIINRKNLVVLDRSYVTKIEINNNSKEAEGVIFTRNNGTYIARNRKEIILSAGTFSSPQILMLSGIGPHDHLKSLGIPVTENLPVGSNLFDHTISFIFFSSNLTNITKTTEESVKDFLKGEGSLTRPFPTDAVNWFQTPLKRKKNYPDIEMVFLTGTDYSLLQKFLGWSNDTYKALNEKSINPIIIVLTPCHPKSKGSITLKSSNPFDYPQIDSNILSNDEDMEVLYESVKLTQKLTETEAFRNMNFTLAVDNFPGCNYADPLSKDYWFCYLRNVTGTGFHPVGSCLTGTNSDNGVVDKNLKVFGIERLRVADASVIPFNFAAHINAICNMIGEKVSDVIKNLYEH